MACSRNNKKPDRGSSCLRLLIGRLQAQALQERVLHAHWAEMLAQEVADGLIRKVIEAGSPATAAGAVQISPSFEAPEILRGLQN
jgi:hypothetical protein